MRVRTTGEIGALLRREGLYSSHLTTWRHQRARGELQGLTPAKRGRKADPQAVENAQSEARDRASDSATGAGRVHHRGPKKSLSTLWPTRDSAGRAQMITSTEQLAPTLGVATACDILQVPRSSVYRARQPNLTPRVRPEPVRALSPAERDVVHHTLNTERFADQAPREVYATLLDEDTYLCSASTMYRVLAEHTEVRERRDQLRHPAYTKPELLATRPNQVWSWDITKLLGPTKWMYYYLYVILDIFSRSVVGWLIADRESGALAELLIAETCAKQQIDRDQLTLHADNGGPMIAKPVALLISDLGVAPSHSRPHVSNDNPFSEAQFKTLKYRPNSRALRQPG